MEKNMYKFIEDYMLECMQDSAHDCQHVYRVLFMALLIADKENNVDLDVLITACLLHDIGREKQFKDKSCCHAEVGGEMAFDFLRKNGWSYDKSNHVKQCIQSHRFRTDRLPKSIEAKILFDSDKLDVTGSMGIARTLIYKGQVNEPLYTTDKNGDIQTGEDFIKPISFMDEYHYKLKKLYTNFYTNYAKEIAQNRQKILIDYYENLLSEIQFTYKGKKILYDDILNDNTDKIER